MRAGGAADHPKIKTVTRAFENTACAIDAHERTAGEPRGQPRVKLVRVDDMLASTQFS